MTKYALIIVAGSVVSVLGIATFTPMVAVAGTLCACGTLLLALLSYFESAN
jgi:hypothetical protein